MTADHWQLQEAKQRFSELVRAVHEKGPQFVTRHGKEVVVVVDIADYERTRGGRADFKAFLASAPDIAELEIERDRARAPRVELTTA
jgi:prevent-host-death family protein